MAQDRRKKTKRKSKGLFIMRDFKLNTATLAALAAEVGRLVFTGKSWRVTIVEWREKRSLWLAEIDKQNPLKVVNSKHSGAELWHEVFKKFWCPESVVTDGKTEMVIVSTKLLDVGQMNHYLTQIEHWAMNRGFKLTIPIDSEYMKLMEQQAR